MATAQHPVPARTAVHHNLDWLWIGLSVILVALIAGAVAWAIFRPAVTVPPLPAEVIGFEYSQEATTGMAVQPGVTGEYFGYSGELYPAAALAPSVMGFAYNNDATTGMLVQPGVTGEYFGYSGELYPEVAAAGTLAAITVDPTAMWGTEFSSPSELYPEIAATGPLAAITLDPTAMWGTEFSNPSELYPEVVAAQITTPGEAASLIRSVDRAIAASHLAMLGGFEFDHEVTPGHIASPGVTGQYFGYSGELFADD